MFRRLKQPEVKPEVAPVIQKSETRNFVNETEARKAVIEKEQEVEEAQKDLEQTEELTEEKVFNALIEDRNLLINHDARISAIEAALFRLKALV